MVTKAELAGALDQLLCGQGDLCQHGRCCWCDTEWPVEDDLCPNKECIGRQATELLVAYREEAKP